MDDRNNTEMRIHNLEKEVRTLWRAFYCLLGSAIGNILYQVFG